MSRIRKITVTPTITAGAYSAGDAIGGLLEFENAASVYQQSGIIRNVVITDRAKQSVAMNLWLFNRSFTPTVDNAAFTPTDADLDNCIGVINFVAANWFPAAASSVATTTALIPPFYFKLQDPGDASLYGQLVAVGTPTYAATNDLSITLVIER
jgi:hypothetical protein